MPIVNRIHEFTNDVTAWRRDLHAHPELQYDVHRTAGIVAQHLRDFGCDEVVTGIGKTGVVGVIKGRKSASSKVIGLRADMDALPILEETGAAYASQNKGVMHACGHDGHTSMLLGAARYLAETRNFDGSAVVIFQPAEENGGAGAKAMVQDGLMDRFGIQEVYGMHNMPGMPVGTFALRPGALMASSTRIEIEVEGSGGHAAKPHLCVDPLVVATEIATALQLVVSRNVDPLAGTVLSITQIHAGTAFNIIPDRVYVAGTLRTLDNATRQFAERRIEEIATGIAAAHRSKAKVTITTGYPVTENHPEQTEFVERVAKDIVGGARVDVAIAPSMGAEDFSFMLLERPGAFIFIGNGESAGLHNAKYDFNDAALPVGMSYWARLVETAMPAD
ncbi:M20 aminoacylase family protein [Bradyrhizobium sp. LHD-71]|uniref:M20 aminoacylase family protein n=1 Tax=Bradyrhizobium sp. LHD-71 TaxID=3072141 RepID=UPI00280E2E24|nr:M20 aminoacylase family protein [Bradyrhizobium sp. LHD-71]MDQ8732293.1 M20 aminoacylase family protein [Bradyrhizobium sp. LHD-71]